MTAKENLESCGYKLVKDDENGMEYTGRRDYITFDKRDKTVFVGWVSAHIWVYIYQQMLELGWIE